LVQPAYAALRDYPEKPVRIVVPTRPSGSADAVAQLLSKQLAAAWNAQVVIDHRPGPGGRIGAETVAKAVPDGHTLLLAGTSLATSAAFYRRARYDAGRDLVPVAGVAISPFLIVVHPTVPVRSVNDLIALARKGTDKLPHGCPGPGSEEHLCGELLGQMAGIGMGPTYYETRAASMSALLGGRVPFIFTDVPRGTPHVKSGKVRAIAITSPRRDPGLPNVPAVSETLPGYECATWLALFVPAKTPPAVLGKIAAAAKKVILSTEGAERLRSEGLYAYPGSGEEFARFFRAELPKWAEVARNSGILLE